MRNIINYLLLILFLIISINLIADDKYLVNLGILKKKIKEYYNSGEYDNEMKKIIDDAINNLNNLKLPKNPAFVFDIDETSLSNMEYELKYDFGYSKDTWDNWVNEGKAIAIREVKRFYDTLVSRNIAIIFITGRNLSQFDITKKNLISEGYFKFDTLICRNNQELHLKAIEYKSNKRRNLSEKYTIIGSIGDQWSDLDGGWTILKIKLPNYMYYIE